jgi:hypothetical protein
VGIGYFAVITGAIAERFTERGQEENVEAVEAHAPSGLGAQVDGLALRARELVTELEALSLAVAGASGATGSTSSRGGAPATPKHRTDARAGRGVPVFRWIGYPPPSLSWAR